MKPQKYEYLLKINAPIIRDEQNMLNNEVKFSIDWDFGCGSINYDNLEVYGLDYIEEILDDKWQHNDDLLQIGVLYKCNGAKVCHTMELQEIKWIEDDLLEKVKNNEDAKYFESHCSCDFEFVITHFNEKYIRLTITDKNDEPEIRFDEVMLKEEFLTEMNRVFSEIKRKTDKIVEDYGNRHSLSNNEKEELKTRLYK